MKTKIEEKLVSKKKTRPITPVQNLTRPISPTFSESSGREVSHGPSLDICFFEQISGNERFM